MMAIGINIKQPCRQRQENAATFTNGMLTCEHISKKIWILWMQTIVYECLITYSSSGLAGTPEDKTYNLP